MKTLKIVTIAVAIISIISALVFACIKGKEQRVNDDHTDAVIWEKTHRMRVLDAGKIQILQILTKELEKKTGNVASLMVIDKDLLPIIVEHDFERKSVEGLSLTGLEQMDTIINTSIQRIIYIQEMVNRMTEDEEFTPSSFRSFLQSCRDTTQKEATDAANKRFVVLTGSSMSEAAKISQLTWEDIPSDRKAFYQKWKK